MKSLKELELIENLVKRTYGNRLRESLDVPYKEGDPLGYSWRFDDPSTNTIIYNVVSSNLGDKYKHTAYRIKMHEYGHIYLGHLDGIHEELDRKISEAIDKYRGDIVKDINDQCKIDFGDSLVDKVIDNPSLNHSLHNIAMDMEVNSTILSTDDIEDMEKNLGELIIDKKKETINNLDEETKKKLDKTKKENMIKLILPCRYHKPDGSPFPDNLSYPEYLILILRNLSQFIKSSISIMLGGNGDTSRITESQLKEALKNGAQSLDDILNDLGLTDKDLGENGEGNDGEGNSEEGEQQNDPNSGEKVNSKSVENVGGIIGNGEKELSRSKYRKDHSSPSREHADKLRELGQIKQGGSFGCGSGDGFSIRSVNTKEDEVDIAIDEVIRKTKSKVIKRTLTRNVIRNYNLGKNRSVIVPTIIPKNRLDTKPKLVFIIDISGSMNTQLVDRILKSISNKLKKINRGLLYDIITWSTRKGDWLKDNIPGRMIPRIHTGGGTRMAGALQFLRDNYDKSATFILISDFEDDLDDWIETLETMRDFEGWGFNYGTLNYKIKWPSNFKVKNFNNKRYDW